MDKTPYAISAMLYAEAGWHPIPTTRGGAGGKGVPLAGYTGYLGIHVTKEVIESTLADADLSNSHPNVSLRMVGTVGLDIDAYDDRSGWDTLEKAQADLGELPATFYSTARGAGQSGIRIYRLPPGMEVTQSEVRNIGRYGGNIEVIREAHRYVKCWPSPHPNGSTYQWYHPNGAPLPPGTVPRIADCPELPPEWVALMCTPKPKDQRPKTNRATRGARIYTDDPFSSDYTGAAVTEARAWTIIEAALAKLRNAQDGSIRVTAYGAGKTIGKFVPDLLTRDEAESLLHEAIGHTVYDGASWQAETPIGDGLDAGEEEPREIRDEGGSAEGDADRKCDEQGRVEGDVLDDMFSDPDYPLFGHVRQFARARRISPLALLGVTLMRIAAAVPPYVVLPPLVGGYGSLNSFLCLVGASGRGKGATSQASEDALTIEMNHTAEGVFTHKAGVYSIKIGSGQGFSGMYCYRERPEKATGAPGRLVRERDSVLFTCNEVADMTAKAGGNSTLLGTMCELWMAENLGSAYVDPTKRLPMAKHSYRAGFVLHAQPELMAPLLIEAASSGMPQRFVYLPVTDHLRPARRAPEPESMSWRMPPHQRDPNTLKLVMPVCAEIVEAVDRAEEDKADGKAIKLDGHLMFCQEKLAALIALSAGRTDLSPQDWLYATRIMDVSLATRNEVLAVLRAEKATSIRHQGSAEGMKELAKEEAIEGVVIEKGKKRILTVLASCPPFTLPKSKIQERCSRSWNAAAFDALCASGEVVWEVRDAPVNRPVTYYGMCAP